MTLKSPTDLPTTKSYIVYDPKQREYYNTRTDIFLSLEDIEAFKLKPYSQLPTPLPKSTPPEYFNSE